MGRRSKAQNLLQEQEESEEDENTYIVVYDFRGFKPSKRFWENLHRISNQNPETGLIQYSVYLAVGLRETIVVARLAESYGAEVAIFSASEYRK